MMISKRSLCLIAVLFASLFAFSQSRSDNPADSAIQRCLHQKKWLPHQCFEIFTMGDITHCSIYNGIPDSLFAKRDSLKQDGTKMITELAQLIADQGKITHLSFVINYFDRNSQCHSQQLSYIADFKDGERIKFCEYVIEKNDQEAGDTLKALMEQMHHIKLSPSQYLLIFQKAHGSNGENIPFAVHLVTMIDRLPSKRKMKPKSQRQFGWLARQLAGFPYLEKFCIVYQQREDATKVISRTYTAPQW